MNAAKQADSAKKLRAVAATDPDASFRLAALECLAQAKSDGGEWRKAIDELTRHRSREVRNAAAAALERLSP